MYSPRFGLGHVTLLSQSARARQLQRDGEIADSLEGLSRAAARRLVQRRLKMAGLVVTALALVAFAAPVVLS